MRGFLNLSYGKNKNLKYIKGFRKRGQTLRTLRRCAYEEISVNHNYALENLQYPKNPNRTIKQSLQNNSALRITNYKLILLLLFKNCDIIIL